MIGVSVSIKDEVRQQLDRMLRRMKNQKPLWNRVGILIHRSVMMNFREGGRPEKWKKSIRVLKHGGETLVDSGLGRSTIRNVASNVQAVVGSPLGYMRKHQEGDNTIERKFLVIQEVDKKRMVELAQRFIRDGK